MSSSITGAEWKKVLEKLKLKAAGIEKKVYAKSWGAIHAAGPTNKEIGVTLGNIKLSNHDTNQMIGIQILNDMAQGDGMSTRTGNMISPVGVTIRGGILWNESNPTATQVPWYDVVRWAVVQDRMFDGEDLALQDVFCEVNTNPATYAIKWSSGIKWQNKERFKILKTGTITNPPGGLMYVNPNYYCTTSIKVIDQYIDLRKIKAIRYKNTGGTYTSCGHNSIMFCIWRTIRAGTEVPPAVYCEMNSKLTYYD